MGTRNLKNNLINKNLKITLPINILNQRKCFFMRIVTRKILTRKRYFYLLLLMIHLIGFGIGWVMQNLPYTYEESIQFTEGITRQVDMAYFRSISITSDASNRDPIGGSIWYRAYDYVFVIEFTLAPGEAYLDTTPYQTSHQRTLDSVRIRLNPVAENGTSNSSVVTIKVTGNLSLTIDNLEVFVALWLFVFPVLVFFFLLPYVVIIVVLCKFRFKEGGLKVFPTLLRTFPGYLLIVFGVFDFFIGFNFPSHLPYVPLGAAHLVSGFLWFLAVFFPLYPQEV
jgi:hypothetical protein